MSFSDMIVNVTYIVYVLAPLVKRELLLRMVLAGTSVGYTLWGLVADLPWVVFWNVLFIVMSIWRIAKLLRERRPVELSAVQSKVHSALFSDMSDRQFLLFWLMGDDVDPGEGELTREGEVNEFLFVLFEGSATVHAGERLIATVEAVTTVGEMSFVSKDAPRATATVRTVDGRVRRWRLEDLAGLQESHPELVAPFLSGLGRGLSSKVGR